MRVYGGAQGIWVDKETTSLVDPTGIGVTIGILHTGRHYPDDLSDEGAIYHYPNTGRPAGRDRAEIEATKNARRLGLPIFVILPGSTSRARSLRLGWVVDEDDASQQFLIIFGPDKPSYTRVPVDAPFVLISEPTSRMTRAKVRAGQQQFRFQVLAQYGCRCAVCSITHPSLIKAAHIRGKAHLGSDDWRNGIPLCSTHHDAFDAHLFCIDPETLDVRSAPKVALKEIGITGSKLAPVIGRPHPVALRWRFSRTSAAWRASASQDTYQASATGIQEIVD